MKRRATALLVLLIALTLSGCGKQGLENQLLVIILGVDQNESDVKITVKAPSNASSESSSSSSSQSAEQGGDQKGYLMLEATGKDFVEAMSVLNAATPRTLNFSQTREIVIGMKAAQKDDFGTLLESIVTLPRIREHAMMLICEGEANKFIDSHKPYLGVRLSTYIETSLDNYENKGFIPDTSLFEAHRDFAYGHADPLLICGAVNDFKNKPSGTDDQPEDIVAGKLPRKSINAVEMLGAATTDGRSVSGTLTGYEMALINLALGHIQALEINLPPQYVTVTPRYAATLSVDLSGGKAVLSVDLTLDVNKAPGRDVDLQAVEKLVEKDLKSAIKTMQRLRCDGLGFGNIAVRQFYTLDDWERVKWRETYVSAEVKVSVRAAVSEK